jgi:hypothetical protein
MTWHDCNYMHIHVNACRCLNLRRSSGPTYTCRCKLAYLHHTYTHIYIHAQTHTHTHTYTHIQVLNLRHLNELVEGCTDRFLVFGLYQTQTVVLERCDQRTPNAWVPFQSAVMRLVFFCILSFQKPFQKLCHLFDACIMRTRADCKNWFFVLCLRTYMYVCVCVCVC